MTSMMLGVGRGCRRRPASANPPRGKARHRHTSGIPADGLAAERQGSAGKGRSLRAPATRRGDGSRCGHHTSASALHSQDALRRRSRSMTTILARIREDSEPELRAMRVEAEAYVERAVHRLRSAARSRAQQDSAEQILSDADGFLDDVFGPAFEGLP